MVIATIAAALALALRNPWSLLTPQFWAEDGEVFMNQNDQLGARAFVVPYNGYLHFLPRFIAWFASHTVDVAWWPAVYNYFTFAACIGVFIRFASPRVQLPAKPWLILALVLVPGSGEILLNVTNLQWHVAILLLLQLFTAPATSTAQRLRDNALLAIVGLNGPFALLFLPLFAWRAWRHANTDTRCALATVAACAAVQATFVMQAPLPLSADAAKPFDLPNLLAVLGNRLVVWPLVGPWGVEELPRWIPIVTGVPLIAFFLGWSLRRNPDRPLRATLVVTFLLIIVASLVRARADTWNPADMTSGDRYFHLPRILLAWLLILDWHAASRPARWLSRGVCAVVLFANLPHFILPRPTDYRWAEHCDPIRRGVPANINTLPEGYWIEYRGRPPKP